MLAIPPLPIITDRRTLERAEKDEKDRYKDIYASDGPYGLTNAVSREDTQIEHKEGHSIVLFSQLLIKILLLPLSLLSYLMVPTSRKYNNSETKKTYKHC